MTDASTRITIPRDALVVLIGPAGCGKSAFAAQHFGQTQIVSSDGCRALVSDDEADSRASVDAFELMHFIIDKRLKRGRLTVADATNLQPERRAQLLEIARRWGRPAVAIVFDLPMELCAERNRLREPRQVPPGAISGHFARLRETLQAIPAEGFAQVAVVHSAEQVARLQLSFGD